MASNLQLMERIHAMLILIKRRKELKNEKESI